jgi:hypothetical protein
MRIWKTLGHALLAALCATANSQIKRVTVPLGDKVARALAKTQLTGPNAQPFHIKVIVSEPENTQSPYQGSIEEWWQSDDQWRREVVAKDGLRQTIVVAAGKRTERDEGDYFPLWLRSFVTAVFDPLPNAAAWQSSGGKIEQIILPNGAMSDACVRGKSKIGSGDRATDAFSNICFDGEDRLKSIVTPRYSMEFADYAGFGKKQIARKLTDDPEPGTELVGLVTKLENESKSDAGSKLFAPLDANDDRFSTVNVGSAQMEQLSAGNQPIAWPTVRSGNVKGHLAIYISADATGQVREAWPLNSDNAGLEDPARDQVRKWKLNPAKDPSGAPVQVDGALGFEFETKIGNPLPVVTGADIERYETGCGYDPILPAGLLPSGKTFKIKISINEELKDTGIGFPDGIPWEVIQKAKLDERNCRFMPYLVNGKPSYYVIEFAFTSP